MSRPRIVHNRLRAPDRDPAKTYSVSADPDGNREQRRAWAKLAKRSTPAAVPAVTADGSGQEAAKGN